MASSILDADRYGLGPERPAREHSRDFPQGDGAVDCPKCGGRGAIDAETKFGLPGSVPCECTYERDVRDNIERAWRGLTQIQAAPKTNLEKYLARNLWITAPKNLLQAHLHCVGKLLGRTFMWRVITDIDLMDSWLPKKKDILDPDVAMARHVPTDRYTVVTDLVEPPDLLIIRLGVKAARNVAMPELLLEALQHRDQWGKATWIVDSEVAPFTEGHIAYDARVGDFVSAWPRVTFKSKQTTPVHFPPSLGIRPMGLPDVTSEVSDTEVSETEGAETAPSPTSNRQGQYRAVTIHATVADKEKAKGGKQKRKNWRPENT